MQGVLFNPDNQPNVIGDNALCDEKIFTLVTDSKFLEWIGLEGVKRVRLQDGVIQLFTESFPRNFKTEAFRKPEKLEFEEQLFSIDLIDFGNGDIEKATDNWLDEVVKNRISQASPFDPRIYRLYFIINDGKIRGATSDLKSSLEEINYRNCYKFKSLGPLTVVDIRKDNFGGATLFLSDGFQIFKARGRADVGLEDKVVVDGEFSQNDDELIFRIRSIELAKKTGVFGEYIIAKGREYLKPSWKRILVNDPRMLDLPNLITFDTETFRDPKNPELHTLRLVQIGDPKTKTVYLVYGDGIKGLKAILENLEIKKIVHYSPFEKNRLREIGIELKGVIDTHELAEKYFPHLQNRELRFLLRWICGVELNKEHQRSLWEPPFTESELDYAQLDVEALWLLYEKMKELIVTPEGSIEELMKNLYELENEICNNQPGLLLEITRELSEVESSLRGALAKGFLQVNSPHLRLALGKKIRVVSESKLKAFLKKTEKLSPELESEIKSLSEPGEQVEIIVKPYAVVMTNFTQRRNIDVKDFEDSLRILAGEYCRLVRELLTLASPIVPLLVRRASTYQAVVEKLKQGERYEGEYGRAYLQDTKMVKRYARWISEESARRLLERVEIFNLPNELFEYSKNREPVRVSPGGEV